MLEQTRRAIEGLKAAGFERGEFRVRTPMNRRREYEETEIRICASREKQVAAIPALAEQGFVVTRYIGADGFEFYPSVRRGYGGGRVDVIRFAEDGRVASYEEGA